MNFKSVNDILDFAIEKEVEAVEFYKEASEFAHAESIKESLLNFSNEEDKHRKMLTSFKENQTKIDSYEFKKITDLKRSDYLVVDIEYEKGMNFPDILRLAMKREEMAVKLYENLSSLAKDSNMDNLFMILVQEESKHKNILETMYDDHMAEMGD
jgi:rubrerythrin